MVRLTGFASVLFMSSVLAVLSGTATLALAAPSACDQLAKFKITGAELVITRTESVSAAPTGTVRLNGQGPETIPVGLPAYTVVSMERSGLAPASTARRTESASPLLSLPAGMAAFCSREAGGSMAP